MFPTVNDTDIIKTKTGHVLSVEFINSDGLIEIKRYTKQQLAILLNKLKFDLDYLINDYENME